MTKYTQYPITALNIFPVKSLAGNSVTEAYAEERGFRHDRRWMIVDENNKFITQRKSPEMGFLGVHILPDGIAIFDKKNINDSIEISHQQPKETVQVTVWDDVCKAEKILSPEVFEWLSGKTGTNCSLVYATDDMQRKVDPRYSPFSQDTAFADGFPYLLANTASLRDLNAKAGRDFEMTRFRPNIVFEGDMAFQEDSWKKIRIGEVVFHLVKPSARCVIITIDPATGMKSAEPLKTLAEYRKHDNKIWFAMNMVAENEGVVKTGDQLEVLERQG